MSKLQEGRRERGLLGRGVVSLFLFLLYISLEIVSWVVGRCLLIFMRKGMQIIVKLYLECSP